jgi:protein-L-isoaspartate(D-aspartate) O-methyltransferase
MTRYEVARTHMIASQLRTDKVVDERVCAAFAAVPRERFVPEPLRAVAYVDEDLPLGRGRYLMKPVVAGRLLQAAGPRAAEAALVVGAGTGYEAALLGNLVRSAVAVEQDEALARLARFALAEQRIASVAVVEDALSRGHRARAPYEVIFFAGAIAEAPAEIVGQLAEGGRLVAVLREREGVGRALLLTRTPEVLARRILFDASIPFLPGFAPEPAFAFAE